MRNRKIILIFNLFSALCFLQVNAQTSGIQQQMEIKSPSLSVTFHVDVHRAGLVSGENVYMAGSFGGGYGLWDEPGTNPSNRMEDPENDSVYSLTMELVPGIYYYKYFKGNGWGGGEWAGNPNRQIYVDSSRTVYQVWGVKPVAMTFYVDMHGSGLLPEEPVYISGNFGFNNGIWDLPGSNLHNMLVPGADSVYSITVTVDTAGIYEYKFFKGPGWDGNEWGGGPNRLVFAYNDDVWVNALWAFQQIRFTMNVDTRASGILTGDSVFFSGNFGGSYGSWDVPGTNRATLLTDADHDSVYTSTLLVDLPGAYEFKYFHGSGWEGGEWSGGPNRVLQLNVNASANYIWGDPASAGYEIAGQLAYANPASTPLGNIMLTLKDAWGGPTGTVQTGYSGNYVFMGIPNGQYAFEPFTAKPWGGVTAADVLLYKKHIANISTLTGIYLASGDVNGNGSLTASDVLLIKKRIAMIIGSFPVGDWLFDNEDILIDGSNVTSNFHGLVYGDANGTYLPPYKGSPEADRKGAVHVDMMRHSHGETIVALSLSDMTNLGSYQFTVSYDATLFRFTGAGHLNERFGDLTLGNPVPGRLTFVWAADGPGFAVSENETLCLLHFSRLQPGEALFTVTDDPVIQEFTNYDGTRFVPEAAGCVLGYPAGADDVPTEGLVVLPNPFTDILEFSFALEREMATDLRLYNSLGKEVAIIVNQATPAGSFHVRFDGSALAKGIYFYRLKAGDKICTGKVIKI